MPFTLPTIDDFKSQFARDFPYAVRAEGALVGAITIVAGVITAVAVAKGGTGYLVPPTVTLSSMTGTGAVITPVVANGQVTGFTVTAGGINYAADTAIALNGGSGDDTDLNFVTDGDISGAILDAQYNTNQGLFGTQAQWSRAYCYLAAHMLVTKLMAAGQGLASQYNWLTTSKGVGDVSESFQIPEQIAKNPFLAALSKTTYGAMYLTIIAPLLVGNMFVVRRQTLP